MILAKTLAFTILVPGTVFGLVPYLIARAGAPALSVGGVHLLGLVPIALGTLTRSLP